MSSRIPDHLAAEHLLEILFPNIGRSLRARFAELGVEREVNKQGVEVRRVVAYGPWEVDPDA